MAAWHRRSRIPSGFAILVITGWGALANAQEPYQPGAIGQLVAQLGDGLPGTRVADQATAAAALQRDASGMLDRFKREYGKRGLSGIRGSDTLLVQFEEVQQCERGEAYPWACQSLGETARELGVSWLAEQLAATACLRGGYEGCLLYAELVEPMRGAAAARAVFAAGPPCDRPAHILQCLVGVRATIEGSLHDRMYNPYSSPPVQPWEIRDPLPPPRFATAQDASAAARLGVFACQQFRDPPSCVDYTPAFRGLTPLDAFYRLEQPYVAYLAEAKEDRAEERREFQESVNSAYEAHRSWVSRFLEEATPALQAVTAVASEVSRNLPLAGATTPLPATTSTAAASAGEGPADRAARHDSRDCVHKPNTDYHWFSNGRGKIWRFEPGCTGSRDRAAAECRAAGGPCDEHSGTALPAY